MQTLLKLVKHFEGCRLDAYLDPVGIPTIGFGETEGVKLGMKISQEIADALLEHRMTQLLEAVERLTFPSKGGFLKENEEAALCSFAYNLGIGALTRSTLLRKVNNGADFGEIDKEFMRWTKAGGKVLPGLVRRRAAESKLFRTGELDLS